MFARPGDLPDGIWFGSPVAWTAASIDFEDPGMFQACPDFCIVWIHVNAGQVTEIVSQFVP